jgi:hypothetical protein
MKIQTETTARKYSYSEQEIRKQLQLRGKIQSVEFKNDEFSITTIEEKTQDNENPIKKMLNALGNAKIM